MKTSKKLLAATVLMLSSNIAMAELSYDPTEDYYLNFYGDKAVSGEELADSSLGLDYDPIANYYETFYGMASVQQVDNLASEDLADPTNFYNW